MKFKILIFLSFLMAAGIMSLAQVAPKKSAPFPFSQYNDPKLSLINVVSNPEGYERYPSKRLTLYQHWLSNLPLKPKNTPVLNWKGEIISKADTLNGIMDINMDSKYITDADIPVLLIMHFYRLQGKLEEFNINLKDNLVVNYKDWLRGKYIDEKDRDVYFRNEGLRRIDTDEEFENYIDFVTKIFDTKALRKNVEHVDSRAAKASHMFIQFREDDPDSVGHTAIVLDIAVLIDNPRKMLIAHGGNPAQSVVVPRAGYTVGDQWYTLEELREGKEFKKYGMGYMYRWKE